MRMLHRDPALSGSMTIVVALGPNDETPSLGSLASDFEGIGVVEVLAVREIDPGDAELEPGERAVALDVQALEATGEVPDPLEGREPSDWFPPAAGTA